MSYILLGIAIVTEVVATMSLRASDGLSKWPFVVLVVVGYIVAFGLLSVVLERGIPLGVAYGVWTATGVAAVAVLSVPIFGESLTFIQGFGILMVMIGVLALELGGSH